MKQPPNQKEAQYSMRVVTRITGLTADTIRAWERRYQVVVPDRSEGNTRRYSLQDVKRLTLFKNAIKRGYRIGDIAHLSGKELDQLEVVGNLTLSEVKSARIDLLSSSEAYKSIIEEYLFEIGRFESRNSSTILSRASVIFNPFDFIVEIVLPIMRETGHRWERREWSIAHEHLVTQQVRSLFVTITRHSIPFKGAPRIVATTPSGQLHEFGALAGSLLAAMRGLEVLYLGPDVTQNVLIDTSYTYKADIILLSIIHIPSEEVQLEFSSYIEQVSRCFETWVGLDPRLEIVKKIKKAKFFSEFESFSIALTKLIQ